MTIYALGTAQQNAYRNALNIADAPAFIDTATPITPVAIIANATDTSTAQYVKLTGENAETNALYTLNKGNSLQTIKSGVALITTNTTTTLYTATSGKTFYLMGLAFSGVGAAGDGAIFQIRNDGTVFFRSAAANNVINSPQIVSSYCPMTAVASTKVLDVVTTSIGTATTVSWWGFEQ